MILPPGSTSVSLDVQIVDDEGLPVTGLDHTTAPDIYYQRTREADVQITLASLATVTAAWSSGGFVERGRGWYRLDLPDAALATASRVRITGEATDKRVIAPPIQLAALATSAEVATRLAAAAYTAPDNAGIEIAATAAFAAAESSEAAAAAATAANDKLTAERLEAIEKSLQVGERYRFRNDDLDATADVIITEAP